MRFAPGVAAFVLSAGLIASVEARQTAPADNPACSWLTKDDAAAALGESVTGPKATGRAGGPWSCEYTGSGLHQVHLNVIPFTAAEAGMYKAMCAQKTHDGLTGLGDTACWYNDKHEELQVLTGTRFLSIELRRSGDPTEAIKGVMRKVYDRAK
jgi:hypothetical protein